MSKFAAALRNHAAQEAPTEVVEPIPFNTSARRVGRPAGKRSDEGNTQVTAYVPSKLYDEVRIRLIQQRAGKNRKRQDFSDLMREWMERWLAE